MSSIPDDQPTPPATGSTDPGPTETPPPLAPLLELRESLPPVTADDPGLAGVAARIAAATGPVAIDAERASGYRYSARAYLVQLRREGAGTALVDPIEMSDLTPLAEALTGPEWILHAATQDLPCLRELGLAPTSLFDTELAGRLLGYPRVGLATLVGVGIRSGESRNLGFLRSRFAADLKIGLSGEQVEVKLGDLAENVVVGRRGVESG